MVLDNNSIIKLIRDITLRLSKLEKQSSCAIAPVIVNNPVNPPSVNSGNSTTDYAYNLLELVDGMNTIFTLRNSFVVGTTKIYLDGQRLTPGINYDYIEVTPDKIQFLTPPRFASNIAVDYNKL